MLCCAKQQTNYNYLWYHFGANYVILGLRGGDYRGTGGHTRPPTFWLGGRKGKCPPPLIAHLVKFLGRSLQNAYLSEELKGFCIIKIQFLFSFRGVMPL